MAVKMRRAGLPLLLAAALVGCGEGDGDGGDAPCPNVAGSWVVTESCMPARLGSPVNATQSGCTVWSDWGGSTPTSTTVDSDGYVAFTITIGPGAGLEVACTGSGTADKTAFVCQPGDCKIALEKR